MSAAARWCVLYLNAGREHQSPWFSSRDRAAQALAVLRARYGSVVIYRD